MTVSKEEALKHLDELEKKIAKLQKEKESAEALGVQTQKNYNDLLYVKDENEQLKSESKKLTKQVLELSAEKAELSRKLEGYAALDKALGQIKVPGGVTLEQVKAAVREEVAKVGPVAAASPGAGSAELPTLIVDVARPDVVAEDTSLKGGLAILIQEGFFDKNRSIGNTKTRLNAIGLVNPEKDVEAELMKFCQWRLLEMEFTDRRVFRATEGAKERVKLR